MSGLKAGDRLRRATIEDVAAQAEVSTATVSRVINGTGQVSASTAQRVQSAIEQLNYIPSGAARDLARRQTNIIGLVVPGYITPHFSNLFKGIDSAIANEEYSLLVYVNHFRPSSDRQLSIVLGEHNTDGLIIFTNSVADKVIQRLHRRDFPMVLLHRSPPEGTQIPCITLENYKSVYQLIEHLIINCGHRRIAHLGGLQGNRDAQEREAAYRDAIEANGIAFDEQLIGPGDFMASTSEQTVAQWLANGLEFDAIFAADDNSAVGAMTALRAAGKRIPEDVAVVGFNDDFLGSHLTPRLTTVHADTEVVGYEAAMQLLRLIQGKSTKSLIRLPTQLVIRESCGHHL